MIDIPDKSRDLLKIFIKIVSALTTQKMRALSISHLEIKVQTFKFQIKTVTEIIPLCLKYQKRMIGYRKNNDSGYCTQSNLLTFPIP